MRLAELVDFLRDRDVEPAVVQPLTGGEKNVNWRVDAMDGRRFVLRSYQLSAPAEVEYEVHAVAHLAESGFPTPAPIPARDGRLWGTFGLQPAALFTFANGTSGDRSDDETLGHKAAAMAGRLHAICGDRAFEGKRAERRDPLAKLRQFLDSPHAELPALREATERLRDQHDRMAAVYAEPDGLRHGLVHHDITAVNLLLARDGDINALIDFDDCVTSFQLYDLGPIVDQWGRRQDRHADRERIGQLIEAYDATRPLTPRERDLATDFVATSIAATGVHVLTNKLRAGHVVRDPRESYSMLLFLDLAR